MKFKVVSNLHAVEFSLCLRGPESGLLWMSSLEVWEASLWQRAAHPQLGAGAVVDGGG